MSESPAITAEINSYAIRCFRNVGDLDYIAARLAYRASLGAQFLWSAQQSVEKYLKCILILNRIETGDLGHDLQKALDRINTKTDFTIIFKKSEQQIFDQLNNFGANRYLEFSWAIFDHEIVKLDRLVWYLRQYCRPMADIIHDGKTIPMRSKMIKSIESSRDRSPQLAHILGGKIEKILKQKDHPARAGLVWQNAWYCAKPRKSVRLHRRMQSENAPLYLRPEVIEYIEPLVYLSKSTKSGYRELANKRKKDKG